MSEKKPQQRFTGIWIPVEILERDDLSYFEMFLLSIIDSLYCKEHGGCFASNEYISKIFKVEKNTITKKVTGLRKKGYIQDVSFDGRERVIRSKIAEVVVDEQTKAGVDLKAKADVPKTGTTCSQNGNTCMGQIGNNEVPPSLYTYRKGYRKDIYKGSKPPKPPAPTSKSKSNPKKERATFVHTTNEEHEKLGKDFGEVTRDKAYEYLSLWKQDRPKTKWGKSDYLGIRRWVIDAVKEKESKSKGFQKDRSIHKGSEGDIYKGAF